MDIPKRYLNFSNCLKQYNKHINIYSSNAYDKLAYHIQDCINIATLIGNEQKNVVDFGSGSGLPSVMIANENPLVTVHAIESKEKKRRFIKEVKMHYGLHNLHVFDGDIDQFLKIFKEPIDLLTAKAFASLDKINTYLKRSKKSVKKRTFFLPLVP